MRGPRFGALAMVCLGAVAGGCGRLTLGRLTPDAGGAPAKPAAVLAWEPRAVDPYTRITAVFYGKKYAMVGFSDGEVYSGVTGPNPSWTRLDVGSAPTVRPLPHVPVSALMVVDEDSGPSHVCVGYVGIADVHTVWVKLDATSDWYDFGPPATTNTVFAFARSPFDPQHLLVMTTFGPASSTDGGRTWGSAWPGIGFDGSISAITEGRSPTGQRRAWLGDMTGGLYFADSNPDLTWPATPIWTRVPDVVFPSRPVAAVSVNPTDPAEVWLSFRFLQGADALWRSSDYGEKWANVHNVRLLDSSIDLQDSGLGAVVTNPTLRINYTTAIVSGGPGFVSAVGFWSTDAGHSWFLN